MIIGNNDIRFASGTICFEMTFDRVEAILRPQIFTKKDLDQNGLGHIILKNEEFCGLKGMCTIYFQVGVVKQISMVPEWNLYDLNDSDGKRLQIDKAVEKIAGINNDGLKKRYGAPIESSSYGNFVYETGNNTIVSSISRSGDNYSLIIR